ncbi:MAG: tyrosine-type recombinase/integrase [Bacteroidota bacterium]
MFLNYLQVERRFSKHTMVSYQTDLRQFSKYILETYELNDIKEVSHLFIRSWIVSLIENGIDPKSVNRKITALRSFYKFLIKTEVLDKNPMLKIQAPKVSKKLPEFLDDKKMDTLFDFMSAKEPAFDKLRDYLMLDFFYRTGVRLSELIELKLQQVNLFNLTVAVTGKRNKVRQIPISIGFKQAIEKYLEARKIFLKEQDANCDFFFTDNKGNKMYPVFVYRIVKANIKMVSTGKKKSPHVLRHTFATTMLNNGADINAIKELLGHSNLSATQVYTHNTIEKLKEVYKQAFPKA